ncbi:ABC transporter substrate-binding protein [Dactylosporangium sp. NPDC051485]|uniref:ABC transporter substrate-binding protein n=1 Tax=Dactylosporangium sp. NPDC051485 TaxID=3154846 RepID=UPI00341CA03D
MARYSLRRTLACSIVLVPMLAACGGNAAAPKSAPTSLVAAWPSDVSTMDPADTRTDQDKELAMNVYQNLVGYQLDASGDHSVSHGLTSTPAVASSWSIAADTVTFTLRQGLKFYPSGNPLTAKDVVWSLQRALQLNGAIELNNSGVFKPEQITAPDDSHVAIRYTDSAGAAIKASDVNLATLRTCWYGIVDSAVARGHATADDPIAKEWLKNNSAGSGPYYVKSRQVGQTVNLAAVPGNEINKAAFESVTLRVVSDGNVATLLKGKSVNVALYGLSPRDTNSLKGDAFRVAHAETSSYVYLQLASDTGPFADQRVRQAVAHVLPYDGIVKNVYFGQATRADSYVAAAAPGYEPAWKSYADKAAATDLMAKAGNPKINTKLRYPSEDPTYATEAQLIKDALKPLGIEVTLEPQTSAAMFKLIVGRATSKSPGAPDDGMVLFGLSTYVEDAKTPVKLWSVTGGVVNFARTSIAEVDSLQSQYAMAAPSDERTAAYRKIQQLVAQDAGFLPLVLTGRTMVSATAVTNLTFTPEPVILYWALRPTT